MITFLSILFFIVVTLLLAVGIPFGSWLLFGWILGLLGVSTNIAFVLALFPTVLVFGICIFLTIIFWAVISNT